jgi:hypothetical protein
VPSQARERTPLHISCQSLRLIIIGKAVAKLSWNSKETVLLRKGFAEAKLKYLLFDTAYAGVTRVAPAIIIF